MVVKETGRVGIGTSAPATKLDVYYAGSINATTPGKALYNLHLSPSVLTADYATGITFGSSNSATVPQAGIYVQSSDSYGTKMYFGTTDAYTEGSKTRMTINHLGNVGIATNLPFYKLHVTTSSTTDIYVGYLDRPSENHGAGRSTLYAYRSGIIGATNGGTSYSNSGTDNAVKGYVYWGNEYTFGVAGYNYNDYTRCGGTIGANSSATWGSLGYKNSGDNAYGAYWTSSSSGSGFNASGGAYAGIGAGGVGDMLGLWSRGKVMGQIVAGELFSSYNLGNTYTSGTQVEIINTGNEKIPAYSVTSREMKVYDNGFAQIAGNEIYVPFDKTYTNMIKNERPVVTITPIGQNANIYIKSITTEGFTVASDNQEFVEFSWISVGTRVDNENVARFPKDLKDGKFDENLKDFMFNENNLDRNAKAMWWDGNKINFGILPDYFNKPKPKKEEMH